MEVLVMFLNAPAYRYDPQFAQYLELLTGSKQIQAHHMQYCASWLWRLLTVFALKELFSANSKLVLNHGAFEECYESLLHFPCEQQKVDDQSPVQRSESTLMVQCARTDVGSNADHFHVVIQLQSFRHQRSGQECIAPWTTIPGVSVMHVMV